MYTIRRYKPSDREQLRYIAMETAWNSYKKTDNRRETVKKNFIFNETISVHTKEKNNG